MHSQPVLDGFDHCRADGRRAVLFRFSLLDFQAIARCQVFDLTNGEGEDCVRWATFRDELARLSEEYLACPDIQDMVAERETCPRMHRFGD